MTEHQSCDLKERCCFVLGGSQGTGRLIALACAKAGANIVLAGPHMESLEKVAKEIQDCGAKCLPLECDLTKSHQIHEAFQKAMGEFGHVNILVNNAAVGCISPLDKVSEKDLNHFHKVNVSGRLLATQHALCCFKMYYDENKKKCQDWKCPPLWILNIGSAWSNPRHATLERAHMLVASNLTAGAQNELTWSTASYMGDVHFGLKKDRPDIDARCVQISPAVFDAPIAHCIAEGLGMTLDELAQTFSMSKTVGDPQIIADLCCEVLTCKRIWNNGEIYDVEGDGHVRNIGSAGSYWAPQQPKAHADKQPEARIAPPVA